MNSIKSIFLILISFLIFSVLGLEVKASGSFQYVENKIYEKSSEVKIKKLQLALKDFGIYTGKIDGKYSSVKDSLIAYQKKAGIKKHFGYFGKKTLSALKRDYPNKFEEVVEKYLKIEKPSTEIREFIVTAYYSPIPGQVRYSYSSKLKRYRTYSEAIRMQGKGTHGASGKAVHSGFIAAPRNYPFGTKIELEGLGVGVVEDRGQAIVNAGERNFKNDRIDVWMGFGDDGRLRADKWGSRTVKGKIVPNDTEITMEFTNSFLGKYSTLKVDAKNPKKENVVQLQKLFKEAEKYDGKIDGEFKSIKPILVKYQIENNIIDSKTHPHAGYFGKKTYLALRKEFGEELFKNRNIYLDDLIIAKDVKKKMDKLNNKINILISQKYGKNTPKAISYRNNLKRTLEKHIYKIKNKERKKHLKYLLSII